MKPETRKKHPYSRVVCAFCAAVMLLACTACSKETAGASQNDASAVQTAQSAAVSDVTEASGAEAAAAAGADSAAETAVAAVQELTPAYETFETDDAVGIRLLDSEKEIASADYTIIGYRFGDDGSIDCYYNMLSGVALTPEEDGTCSVPKDAAIAELELSEGAGYVLLTEVKETEEDGQICWSTDRCSVSGKAVQVRMYPDETRSAFLSGRLEWTSENPAFKTMLTEHFCTMRVSSRGAGGVPYGINAGDWELTGYLYRDYDFSGTADQLPVKAVPVSQLEDGFLYQIHILYEDGTEYTTEPETLQEGNGESLELRSEYRETVTVDNMTFTLYGDHAALSDYDDSTGGSVLTIPDEVEGLPVTVIAYGACANTENLRQVVFPDTLRRIEGLAFYSDCLTALSLPESVEYIGEEAFGRYSSVLTADDEQHAAVSVSLGRNVYWVGEDAFSDFTVNAYAVGSGNQTYSTIDGALCSADGTWLYSVPAVTAGAYQVPDGVTTVVEDAFQNTAITTLTLPDSVESFDMGGNGLPGTVTSLVIGSGLENWYYNSLSAVTAMESITISEENATFRIQDELLCNPEMTALYACLQKEDVWALSLPETLTYIKSDAFSGNSSVWGLTFPAGMQLDLTEAELSDVLSGVTNLSEITVEDGNSQYMSVDGVLYSADGSVLIAYPAGATATGYEVPEGVTTICGSAFPADCLLTELRLPATLTALHAEDEAKNIVCFADVEGLSDVYVADSNPNFSSTGAMFTDLTSGRLLFFSANCSDYILEIPAGTIAIEDAVFDWEKLKQAAEIRIPEGVTAIGADNFNSITYQDDQWDVLDIYLPDSLTEISEESFENSDKVVIHASAGSYAAEFAQAHGLNCVTE